MQRQHRRKRSAIVGDVERPALLDFERDARTQLRQQKMAWLFEPRRAQLFIQMRAISSYSSGRAGRMVGVDIE